jgi:hypothetical protein
MKFKQLAEELLKNEKDRSSLPQNPTLFGMEDIWTGMQDLGMLAALEDAEKKLLDGINEEE